MHQKYLFQYNRQHNCKEIKCNEMNTVPHQYLFHLLFTLSKNSACSPSFLIVITMMLCAKTLRGECPCCQEVPHILMSSSPEQSWRICAGRRRRRISRSDKLRTWDRIASCNHHSQTYFEMKTTTKQPPTSRQYSKAWNIYRLTTEPHFILKY